MNRINQTLDFFCEYLEGNNKVSLSKYLKKVYKNKLSQIFYDFHDITIQEFDIFERIREILALTEVDPKKQDRFNKANITLFEFLNELQPIANTKQPQLEAFIDYIQSKDKRKKNIATYTTIGVLLTIYLAPLIINNLEFLKGVFNATLSLPVVGLVYTMGAGIYTLYQTVFDRKIPVMKRFTDNFFLFANTALNVAAYSVLISAAVSVSPVAAILYVAASAVNVFKEVYNLVSLKYNSDDFVIKPTDTLAEKQTKARQEAMFIKTRNNLITELGSSAALLAIIAVWSFVPGGIFLSVGAVAAMGLVYLTKTLLVSLNEKSAKLELEKHFEALEAEEGEFVHNPAIELYGLQASNEGQPQADLASQQIDTNTDEFEPGRASSLGMFAHTAKQQQEKEPGVVEEDTKGERLGNEGNPAVGGGR